MGRVRIRVRFGVRFRVRVRVRPFSRSREVRFWTRTHMLDVIIFLSLQSLLNYV